MNDEVKIRFKTSFDAIRESFKTTFAQMFVSGLADLELTSDNLLEAGVEIPLIKFKLDNFLPGGCTLISTPASKRLSLVNSKSASPLTNI